MYDRHLDIFVLVAEYKSFSKAAKKLNVSPQAVLKQIQLLEDRLELKLFSRSPNGLVLTGGG